MAKHWEVIDHTADTGLDVRADSLAELFEGLGEGLAEMICPRGRVRPEQSRQVQVRAEDREALAVDFLVEVMNLLQVERFMAAGVRVREIDEHHVAAELAGEPYDPHRHEIDQEIKAVTYHELRVEQAGDGWAGRVIFDI